MELGFNNVRKTPIHNQQNRNEMYGIEAEKISFYLRQRTNIIAVNV